MAGNKANIKGSGVEIFAAVRSSDATPVTLPALSVVNAGGDSTWKLLAPTREGSTKISGAQLNKEILQDGSEQQLSTSTPWESEVLDSSGTMLATIESFLNASVDILFREVGKATCHRIQKTNIACVPDFPLSAKKANVYKISGDRLAGKLSDVYDQVTLT
jgi:hypothetical protein